jgi:hypothetical protein
VPTRAALVKHIGRAVAAGAGLGALLPCYPQIARSANVRGVVILELSVDTEGAVTSVRALNDLPLLAQTAVAQREDVARLARRAWASLRPLRVRS